eukprot:TRINITY_DN25249_c0_g1_i1.p1 TRINITY_DN25249_c0_g1~~TRINITY_DN25249_c0_g1_i1.p1  ORF type:complete len:156 (+),score=6.52 TRINITY_DN25249_c0_g1_i1:48-470(+)
MQKLPYLHKLMFGGVVGAAATAYLAWRCCARPPQDTPAAEAAGADSQGATADAKGSTSGSPTARAQRRVAGGPCPRPRPPAAETAAAEAGPPRAAPRQVPGHRGPVAGGSQLLCSGATVCGPSRTSRSRANSPSPRAAVV